MRVQPTRVLLPAVARRSPLTRRPLGPQTPVVAWRLSAQVLAVLVIFCLGCQHVNPSPYYPDAKLREELSALPTQRVIEVALEPEGSGAGSVQVPERLWRPLFTVLKAL